MVNEKKCHKCKKFYVERDDDKDIWHPELEYPVGPYGYSRIALCPNCSAEIRKIIREWIYS